MLVSWTALESVLALTVLDNDLVGVAAPDFFDEAPDFGIRGEIFVSSDSSNSAASRDTELEPKMDKECKTDARRVAHAYEPGFSKLFGVRENNCEHNSHKFSGVSVDSPFMEVRASAATIEKNAAFL